MRRRIEQRELPRPPWRYTDDTEMALAIMEVLEESERIDQGALAAVFARRYRGDPTRGYGSTAHQILGDLAVGLRWQVVSRAAFNGAGSMGNGGAMRVAPLGAYFAEDLDVVVAKATASAEVTHAHAEGQAGAVAVAVAAALAWTTRGTLASEAGRLILMLVTARDRTPPGATRDGLTAALALPWVTADASP